MTKSQSSNSRWGAVVKLSGWAVHVFLTFSENVFSPCSVVVPHFQMLSYLTLGFFQEALLERPCSFLNERPCSIRVRRSKSTQFSRRWSMALFPPPTPNVPRPACCTPSWPIEPRQGAWAEEQMKWAARCVCDSKRKCTCARSASLYESWGEETGERLAQSSVRSRHRTVHYHPN